mmetsp:Transcript_32631/g.103323  ORF Transcript_32631/g.103323 Transcript_32631/m.103323 type:complete len:327 (-) Transcript_32631:777-1757(-)
MMSTIRNVRLTGDMLHLWSYPMLFIALGNPRPLKLGVSTNSQMLFFVALLLRYFIILLDTSDLVEAVKFFWVQRKLSLNTLVSMYRKSNGVYVFLLKALPLLGSACAVIKCFFSPIHRDRRDSMHWMQVLVPCVMASIVFHFATQTKISESPWEDVPPVLSRASFFIEAFAIVPQLWMQHAPLPRDVETADSLALELHLVSRGTFRAVYAISWLYKAIRKGEKLHGLSEVSHLTGLLQVFIYSDLFAAFLRKRFKFALLAGFLLYFLLLHASSLLFLQLVLSSMLAAVLLSLLTGGLTYLQCVLLFVLAQLYRAGILTLRSPFADV